MNGSDVPVPENLVVALRFFSYYLGNGTLDLVVLPHEFGDYRPKILNYGSELEQVYTVFLRNLRIAPDGRVVGVEHAQRRAAQWIRQYCDPSYAVQPPFTDQELELGAP